MMATIVSIVNTEEMARTLDRYLCCFLGQRIDSYFMTYEQRLLSGSLFRQTDLFVLELFRRDDIGYRAEAIPVAEKWASAGKRVLIVSGSAKAETVGSTSYWDLGSSDTLHERILSLLESPPASPSVFHAIRLVFADYCRPPKSYHH